MNSSGHLQIMRSSLPDLCCAIHFENELGLIRAVQVIARPREALRKDRTESILSDILLRHATILDLTNLHRHAATPEFEWSYMRYCGSNQVRALLIRSFVKSLQSCGILKARPILRE
jgi:hypothetical protein